MLTDKDRAYYEWQLNVPGFGEEGQAKLRSSTALVSRVGGLGGPLAFSLVAAGFGKIILAHGGELRENDLNRQIVMKHDGLGSLRHEQAAETLRRFNPNVEVESVGENVSEQNVGELVGRSDIVFSCAPLFEERLLMNREVVKQKKLLVDGAMFNMEGHVLAVRGGETTCLCCIVDSPPEHWERRFPVIGALSAMIAQISALEGIKMLTSLGVAQTDTLIHVDSMNMDMRKFNVKRNPNCPCCSA